MARVDIKRVLVGAVEKVIFDPSPVQALQGEAIIWRNLDPKASHRLTLKGKDEDFWFDRLLAPFVEGQIPDVTMPGIRFFAPGSFPYVCTEHDDGEGEIKIT